MKKIASLYVRNYKTDRLVRNEVVQGSEWVLRGEGIATKKYDGTSCMVKNGQLFKRYDVKKKRKVPDNFIPAQDKDAITGHWPGWVPVGDGPDDQFHREAFTGHEACGTYELCGPKIQGNPEGFETHVLIPHGKDVIENVPRNFEEIKDFLSKTDIEGIVWHHKDGRMVKIKAKDFGIKRKA